MRPFPIALTVDVHMSDFVPDAEPPRPDETLGPASFLLRRDGGLRFKVFLRERDPARVCCITQEIVGALQNERNARFVQLDHLVKQKLATFG